MARLIPLLQFTLPQPVLVHQLAAAHRQHQQGGGAMQQPQQRKLIGTRHRRLLGIDYVDAGINSTKSIQNDQANQKRAQKFDCCCSPLIGP
jgi:hypothetical protein